MSTSPSPPPLQLNSMINHGKLKILIVEDNLVNQRVLEKQLRNLGFMTELANHGGEALDVVKTSTFWAGREKDGVELSVILMDLEMPIMDGLTCARTIREYEADGTIVKHVPIIAVTANARLEQIENAIAAGMVSSRIFNHGQLRQVNTIQDDVVSKPFRLPELVPKIHELVTESHVTGRPISPVILETQAGPSSSKL
jgi:CheY-like chemotaxis protein